MRNPFVLVQYTHNYGTILTNDGELIKGKHKNEIYLPCMGNVRKYIVRKYHLSRNVFTGNSCLSTLISFRILYQYKDVGNEKQTND